MTRGSILHGSDAVTASAIARAARPRRRPRPSRRATRMAFDDRPGRRRAVADDAHAVDAEQHGPAVVSGSSCVVERQRAPAAARRPRPRLGGRREAGSNHADDQPRSPPSSVLRTTLPVNPSVTTTSTSSVMRSRPSTLPMKLHARRAVEQVVGLLHAARCPCRPPRRSTAARRAAWRCRSAGARTPRPSGRTAPATRAGTRRWRRRRAAPSASSPGTGIGVAIAGP